MRKKKVIFLLFKTHKEDKLGVFLGGFFGFYNQRELKYSRVEDLATRFCDKVVFVPRGIIVFSQFTMNLGFKNKLSIVISIFIIVH